MDFGLNEELTNDLNEDTEKEVNTSEDLKSQTEKEESLNYIDVLEARSQRGLPTHQKAFALKVLSEKEKEVK